MTTASRDDLRTLHVLLDDLPLSIRARAFVRRRHLRTIADLARFEPAALDGEPNLGRMSTGELAALVESRFGAPWAEVSRLLRAAPAPSETLDPGAGRCWDDLAASVPASLRNTPLGHVPDVPSRVRRHAARRGIATLGALLDTPEEELLRVRNVGPDSLAACRDAVVTFAFGSATWGADTFALDAYPDLLALWRERFAALNDQPRKVLALRAGLNGPPLPRHRVASRIKRSAKDVSGIELHAIRALTRDRAWIDAVGERLLAHVQMGPRRIADIAADDPWLAPLQSEPAVAALVLDRLLTRVVRRVEIDGQEHLCPLDGS